MTVDRLRDAFISQTWSTLAKLTALGHRLLAVPLGYYGLWPPKLSRLPLLLQNTLSEAEVTNRYQGVNRDLGYRFLSIIVRMSDVTVSQDISWTPLLEKYFASVGEKAHCLSWLHNKAGALYSHRRTAIDLPVIVGSGAIAFLNAGSTSLFGDAQLASVALGIGSLVVSVLNTITTYFGWAKRAEGHRIGALHYAKLYRFLCVEMGLPRDERMRPGDLLKTVREQYDRLAETTPDVPPPVIAEFRKKFSHPKYEDIAKPEAANGLEEITVYRPEKDSEAPIRIRLPQSSPVLPSGERPHRTSIATPLVLREPAVRGTAVTAVPESSVHTAAVAVTVHEQNSQSSPAATGQLEDQ